MSRRLRREPNQIWKLIHPDPSSIDWNKVTQRAESHPNECREKKEYCVDLVPTVILHELATLSPPVEALKTVIRAYPRALFFGGEKMPLCLACESGASNDIIRTILQEMQRALVKRLSYYSPIMILRKSIFWDQSCPIDRFKLPLEELTFDFRCLRPSELAECLADLIEAEYDKIKLALMKLAMGTAREEDLGGRRFYILHAFLKLLCRAVPKTHAKREAGVIRVLNMIKERNPDQFREADDDGSLPLHIAATFMYGIVLGGHGGVDHERFTSMIVGFLLGEYPESVAIPDRQGRLPLHIASQDKLPCYEILASAEPRALTTRCPLTRLYSFQLAAVRRSTREVLDRAYENCQWTNMIFTLLRKTPHLVESGVRNEPWKDSQEYLEIQRINLTISQLQARQASLKRKVDDMKGLN